MLRLSRLTDYAVMLMTGMAAGERRVHTAVDVAAATGVPTPTVSKLLATLARHGLLISHRGAKGGYSLARSAACISIAEIIAAVEGPIALTHCIEHGTGNCDVELLCPSRSALQRLNQVVQRALGDVTLAELMPMPPPVLSKPRRESALASN